MDLVNTLLMQIVSLGAAIVLGLQLLLGGVLPLRETALPAPAPLPADTTPPAALAPAETPATSPSTTTPPKKTTTKTAAPAVAKPASATPATTPSSPAPASIDPETLNKQTRDALVNILCSVQSRGRLHSISGTGVLVDSRGVILTNAHIGQYFLLTDYPTPGSVDCTIRVGSPAQPRYRATLLYLPPAWITDNASQIVAEQGMGTGEHDYAFLLITGTTGPGSLPASFPTLALSLEAPSQGASAFLAAYPAGFLDAQTIERNLYTTAAYATVGKLYTFSDAGTVDIVSVGGTVVSQGGSSGGAMVRTQNGALQGIIAVETSAESTADRDLRAITLGHINRSLITQAKKDIVALLSGDISAAAAAFAKDTAPGERAALVKVLEGGN